MKSVQIIVTAVLAAVVVTLESKATRIPVAGKCHPLCVDPVPIDFNGLAQLGEWEVLYATDYRLYLDEQRHVNPVVEGIFRVDASRSLTNGTSSAYTYTATYVDNIAYEEEVDEDGVRHEFRIIPLAITRENAILYYRCSEAGEPGIDARVIAIPKGTTLSDEGLEYLLAIDRKCNFKGELEKLQKGHNK